MAKKVQHRFTCSIEFFKMMGDLQIADDIGEDCESDTKRCKLERAAAAAAAVAASDAAGLTQDRRSG